MGTGIATKTVHKLEFKFNIKGLVLITPKAALSEKEKKGLSRVKYIPLLMINIFRKIDKIGGTESNSVKKFVSPGCSEDVKRQQLIWNSQIETKSIKYTLMGMNWINESEWRSVSCPTLIVAAELDRVTPLKDSVLVKSWIENSDLKIVEGAGHNGFYDMSKIFNEYIEDFIRKLI